MYKFKIFPGSITAGKGGKRLTQGVKTGWHASLALGGWTPLGEDMTALGQGMGQNNYSDGCWMDVGWKTTIRIVVFFNFIPPT